MEEEIPESTEKPIVHQSIRTSEDCYFCTNCKVSLPNGLLKRGNNMPPVFPAWDLSEISICNTVQLIDNKAFNCCSKLKKVEFLESPSAHHQLRSINRQAFDGCGSLARIKPPLLRLLLIDDSAFSKCRQLANLVLPKDSDFSFHSFIGCDLLFDRYDPEDDDWDRITIGLQRRFDDRPVHRVCYHHAATTVPEFRQCIAENLQGQSSLLDTFRMTPIHVFFSTSEPSAELLDVLLDSLPNQILTWKDANNKRPLEYLIHNWSDTAKVLLQRTFEKCMMDRLVRWGATSWMENIQRKVQEILVEDDKEQRIALCNETYGTFELYENVESISILEMALWKQKLKSGWNDGRTNKRQALDREECRCVSGSDIVIPHIVTWLDIPAARVPL